MHCLHIHVQSYILHTHNTSFQFPVPRWLQIDYKHACDITLISLKEAMGACSTFSAWDHWSLLYLIANCMMFLAWCPTWFTCIIIIIYPWTSKYRWIFTAVPLSCEHNKGDDSLEQAPNYNRTIVIISNVMDVYICKLIGPHGDIPISKQNGVSDILANASWYNVALKICCGLHTYQLYFVHMTLYGYINIKFCIYSTWSHAVGSKCHMLGMASPIYDEHQGHCSSWEEVLRVDWWFHLSFHLWANVDQQAGVRRVWPKHRPSQVLQNHSMHYLVYCDGGSYLQ